MKPVLLLSLVLGLFSLSLPCLDGTAAPGAGEEKPPAPKDKPKTRGPVQLTDEALRIHREALLIDGHNDLPWQFREQADPFFRRLDIARPQKTTHTDIPRLRRGNVGAQFWSAY